MNNHLENAIEKLKRGQHLTVHNCSICDYPCGFVIRNETLYYDSGCDCVKHSNFQERSIEDLERCVNQEVYRKLWELE